MLMKYLSLRTWLSGILLGVALVLTLTLQSSNAACGPNQQSDYCSENYGLTGFPSAVSGRTSKPDADFPAVDYPLLPVAGRLTYADHQAIEQEARSLLQTNKQFREDISPHREKPDFDQLVRHFDYASGFDRTIPGQSITLQERIDQADRELRRARDLYAFLAVYADEGRFRADRAYWQGNGLNCPEQPVADDPIADPPVIEDAEKEAVVRNLFLDRAELQVDLEIAIQEYNAKLTEYQGVVGQTRHDVIESQRERAYLQHSPANDPSYRLVRDSKRLTLASQLEYAARVSYLAARRGEYEFAARLSANNVRISDIYRARTADDILRFLEKLEAATNNMVVSDAEINQENFRISVAQHILGLTNEFLGLTGEAAEAERTRRFRAWVAENTQPGTDGKPVLTFNFTTSLVDNGVFSNVIQQAFDRFWLFKLAGIGQPKAGNTGMSVNLITDQSGNLNYRRTAVTQSGVTHLRTRAGCIFDYRLIHPAALVGQEWPANQPPEQATTDFKASIMGANGERTAAFLGRPVSASDWQVQIFAGAPETGLPDLNLQQLTDIELYFSTTRASRMPGDPRPEDCVRADF